jgi:hypothetical protein
LGDLRHEACRIDSFLFGGLLDFLAVLIDTGEEVGLVATQAAVTGQDISEDLFVGVTDVRRAVGVVDGGGEKKHGDRWMGGLVPRGIRGCGSKQSCAKGASQTEIRGRPRHAENTERGRKFSKNLLKFS